MSLGFEGFDGRNDIRDPKGNVGDEHSVAFHIIYVWEDGIHTRSYWLFKGLWKISSLWYVVAFIFLCCNFCGCWLEWNGTTVDI